MADLRGRALQSFEGYQALFPRLDQLPRKPGLFEVECEEAQGPAERRRLFIENRPVGLTEEHNVEQRDADWVEQDAERSEGPDLSVLRCEALDGKVRSQEGAIVKLLARKGLKSSGAHLCGGAGRMVEQLTDGGTGR